MLDWGFELKTLGISCFIELLIDKAEIITKVKKKKKKKNLNVISHLPLFFIINDFIGFFLVSLLNYYYITNWLPCHWYIVCLVYYY